MKADIFSRLIIDYWYKAMLVLCSALLILALTVDIHVITNKALALAALAGICISIGEWINHPLQQSLFKTPLNPSAIYRLSSHNRKPNRLGLLFDILGMALAVLAVTHIVK